ncbi:unnamed protein product [Darwinula stevensoni]|uniref:Neuroguidin n=1 Tax=Darwinula stevensoni TaxID=69355 RepID=A0A7R8X777_9CRUS|nr:unnamed protein product [Darwinula stevensoni]CAG0888832.1 unnamed protein product [Darwinula stevensoni]
MDKELLAEDIPVFLDLLQSMSKEIESQLTPSLISLGMSFLHARIQVMLNYILDLLGVIHLKLHGQSLENSPIIDSIIRMRTTMEKSRPLQHKLMYQINKAVEVGMKGKVDAADPLRYAPHPDALVPKEGASDEDEGAEEGEAKEGPSKPYVIPKFASVPFPGDMTENQEEREGEKKRKRELKREVLEEMKSEYLDTPMEVWDSEFHESGSRKGAKRPKDKETIQYEETYFTRLKEPKGKSNKKRKLMRKLKTKKRHVKK